jgi:hypothetical protein
MRLLNISTFELKEFNELNVPPYVIASHRWTDDETNYKDIKKRRNPETVGYKKVQDFCAFIRRTNVTNTRAMEVRGLKRDCQWLWIDTACIDKSSSAELSESINSMYYWYTNAEVCYAYLSDVQSPHPTAAIMEFMTSQWFTRGWTLQELLAPRIVVFLDRNWGVIGHKHSLPDCDLGCQGFGPELNAKIERITSIEQNVMVRRISNWSFEKVKHWSSLRETTRFEDRAYCLLGLLGINMVPIYGERENAWDRLEEEYRKRRSRQRRPTVTISRGTKKAGQPANGKPQEAQQSRSETLYLERHRTAVWDGAVSIHQEHDAPNDGRLISDPSARRSPTRESYSVPIRIGPVQQGYIPDYHPRSSEFMPNLPSIPGGMHSAPSSMVPMLPNGVACYHPPPYPDMRNMNDRT